MDYYILEFLKWLVLTISIETLVVIILFLLLLKEKKIRLIKYILASILCSFATLPYVWFVFTSFLSWNIYIFVVESFAIIVEMLVYKYFLDISYKKAFLISFIANMISFSIWLILSYFWLL